MDRRQHWERAYANRPAEEASWHEPYPEASLELIERAAAGARPPVIDIGGGASRLVDCLLERGYSDLAVLDVSAKALDTARQRLGPGAERVRWIRADVTRYRFRRRFGVWHDRAAFHFLVAPADRRAYVRALQAGLEPGGHLVIAAFALDGPPRCSGLDVARYDANGLAAELGPEFLLLEERSETHRTPAGSSQQFAYFLFRRAAGASLATA